MCYGETLYWSRQGFILFTVGLQSMSNGVMLAFPSVLNPVILDPQSEIKATPSQASWLASILGISGLVGFLILSPLMQIWGRKYVHIIKNLLMAVSWLIFYYAESLTTLFIARVIQGLGMGGIFLNMIIIGEYVHPSRRGYFTTIQKMTISLGTLMCHLMAVWFSWRHIVAVTLVFPILSIIFTLFWKESPFHLAMVGNFDECERSFHWLNGTLKRNAELEELIRDQKKRREEKSMETISGAKKMFKQIQRRDFIKSFAIASLLIVSMDLSGRNYFKVYVVQIMMELLGSKSTAVYISVGSDLSVIAALVLSCFAVKYLNRRHILLSFGSVTVLALLSVSLILYLKSHNFICVWPWLAPGLVLFINFIVHIGVSPICFVVLGEIFPLELKAFGSCLTGVVFTSSYGTVLKLTPVLMEGIGLSGTYFVYALGLTVCFVTLFFILPETKNKPLLDIEKNLIKDKKATVILLPSGR